MAAIPSQRPQLGTRVSDTAHDGRLSVPPVDVEVDVPAVVDGAVVVFGAVEVGADVGADVGAELAADVGAELVAELADDTVGLPLAEGAGVLFNVLFPSTSCNRGPLLPASRDQNWTVLSVRVEVIARSMLAPEATSRVMSRLTWLLDASTDWRATAGP
jgi:hypothetical protein